MPEFLDDEEIKEKSKDKRVFHICALYEEGEPMENVKLTDGRTIDFELGKCKKCKRKIKITKKEFRMKNTLCAECGFKELLKSKGDIETIVHKNDEKLWGKMEEMMIERMMKNKSKDGFAM